MRSITHSLVYTFERRGAQSSTCLLDFHFRHSIGTTPLSEQKLLSTISSLFPIAPLRPNKETTQSSRTRRFPQTEARNGNLYRKTKTKKNSRTRRFRFRRRRLGESLSENENTNVSNNYTPSSNATTPCPHPGKCHC